MYRHSVVAQKQAGSTLARLYGVHGRLLRTEVALASRTTATAPARRVSARPPRRDRPTEPLFIRRRHVYRLVRSYRAHLEIPARTRFRSHRQHATDAISAPGHRYESTRLMRRLTSSRCTSASSARSHVRCDLYLPPTPDEVMRQVMVLLEGKDSR